jgi:hypothetical protein
MKVNASYADFVTDWEQLLTAVNGEPELANLRSRPLLEQALAEVKATNARQTLHKAERQQATKDLDAGLLKGKDLASHLRAEIRAELGLRAERLVQFRVQPLRAKPRRKKKSPTGEPTTPPTGTSAEGATPKPQTPADPA